MEVPDSQAAEIAILVKDWYNVSEEYAFVEGGKMMPNYRDFIASDPNILFGKPAIKGTRISVEQILDELAGGTTVAELLEDYPRLTTATIYAALAFSFRNNS